MSQLISISVPNDPAILKEIGAMFLRIAGESPEVSKAPEEPPVFTEEEIAETTADAGVELDIDGLPWDARIHASTKSKLASGKWKLKRGVDDATVAAVTAELSQLSATPAPPPAAEEAAPPPAAEESQPITTFAQLMEAITTKGIEHTTVTSQILAISGNTVPSLPMLATRPDLIPAVASALGL